VPASTSSWVQRAGRAARTAGCEGLAILLVKKSALETNPTATAETTVTSAKVSQSQVPRHGSQHGQGRGRGGGRGGRGSKRGVSYAVLHGQKRGTRSFMMLL
jgi:hypothetical protein